MSAFVPHTTLGSMDQAAVQAVRRFAQTVAAGAEPRRVAGMLKGDMSTI